jgi:predicted dehydrogenase
MAGTIGVALVGAGHWGRRLARTLAATDACALVAVCDIDTSRAREVSDAYGGVATGSSSAAMFDDAIDAVVIATPSATHDALVTEALDAGRHVLVAKPLAGSAAAAGGIGIHADTAGLVVMCDQTYRFAPGAASVRCWG